VLPKFELSSNFPPQLATTMKHYGPNTWPKLSGFPHLLTYQNHSMVCTRSPEHFQPNFESHKVQLSFLLGSWAMQRCTTHCTTHDPWEIDRYPLPMPHGLYNGICCPCPMGCTTVYAAHAPWVVQCYPFSMGHGLYNTIQFPCPMGCTTASCAHGASVAEWCLYA
jgi:hypothetical protein